jgi:hypothetical protein
MRLSLNLNSLDDYKLFLRVKVLPRYRVIGREVEFPDEYAHLLGVKKKQSRKLPYSGPSWLYDYQRDITRLAIRKRKFAVFLECGLGKTPIHLEFARHALHSMNKRNVLIVAPLMVVRQELQEIRKFYGDDYPIEQVSAANLQLWLDSSTGIGITNYEAIRDNLRPGKLGGLILVESSMLKSHYGKWGTTLIRLSRGLEWKLCETGTPAPNDRIEYANHAVFLDAFLTVNSFLARFFVNRGQTDNRWEIKPHALRPFYTALSHWSIFVTNPATYGWKDNCGTIPPINVTIHDVEMTAEQNKACFELTGQLFTTMSGGITSRSSMGQIAKGNYKGKRIDTLKPAFIRDLVATWPDESTLIWCLYNAEQERLSREFPGCASMYGATPGFERESMIDAFKAGRQKRLISKSKILGFGLNLQRATRQVFGGLQDSYESYHQCIKRSNRIGSEFPLNVHIPVMEIERPGVETVLRKCRLVQQDTEEQEQLFKENGSGLLI